MKMGKVDGLSRRLDWKVGVDKNNENQIIIKDSWLHRLEKVIIKGLEVEILEKIKKAKGKDKEVVRIVEKIKKAGVKVIQEEKQKMERELVLKERKVYVLKDEELRIEIIQLHYNVLVIGYRRKQKTVELITRNYWWPEVMREVGQYVEGCDLYQ